MDRDNDDTRAAALECCRRLLASHRWAALGTIGSRGYPAVSWVAYAARPPGLILHLSRLAAHTRNLERTPKAAISVSEREIQDADPQCLARLSMEGNISAIAPESQGYEEAVRAYQERLPKSIPRFDFSDFMLVSFVPFSARFVGGFARA